MVHRAHVRAAKQAADAEHRAPRGDGGNGRLDGAGVRDPREDGRDAGLGRLLGQIQPNVISRTARAPGPSTWPRRRRTPPAPAVAAAEVPRTGRGVQCLGYTWVMDVDLPICVTCGVQYPAPREDCPICLDQRQYVGWDGQRWTSLGELAAAGHRGWIQEEGPGVLGVGAQPPTAIGQRALLVRTPAGNVLFDMISYLDDDLVRQIRDLGGIRAIAVSHPHFY